MPALSSNVHIDPRFCLKMFVASIIKIILLFQVSAMSRPLGIVQDNAEVVTTAEGNTARQLLLLDGRPLHSE
jgi:hypothetical protein